MNKNVIFFIISFQAIIFSIYSSDSYILSYNNVKNEHKVHIKESIKAISSHQSIVGSVNPLIGGVSGDNLYVIQIEPFKYVLRCMKQPHSIEVCQKECQYTEIAAEKGLGPKILYQNAEKGFYATKFVEGIHLSSTHLEDNFILEQFAYALRILHNAPITSNVKFDIFECLEQKIESNLQKNPQFSRELSDCLDNIYHIKTAIKKHTIEQKTCHNDVHMMNLFYTPEKTIQFIDWGNAGLGDLFWDLAHASTYLQFSKEQSGFFLEKYFENNVSPLDRAHFILMENIALVDLGLTFLDVKENIPNEIVKSMIFNYLRKVNEETIRPFNTCEDIAKTFFALFQKRIQSPEYKEAFSQLEQS